MREAVIVAGARTPVGRAKKGSLATVRPDDLGALAVQETLKRAGGYDGAIDDLIIGCAMPEAEQGMNMARNIGALAGLPDTTRSEEHTSELQSRFDLVCRLLLEKKNETEHLPPPE